VTKSRRLKWAGQVACMWEKGSEQSILVSEPKAPNKLFGRCRCKCKNNVIMSFNVGFETLDWINLNQDKFLAQ